MSTIMNNKITIVNNTSAACKSYFIVVRALLRKYTTTAHVLVNVLVFPKQSK